MLFPNVGLSISKKNVCKKSILQTSICGETGIRTPGTFRYNGFQDRRIKPLCHLSSSNDLFLKAVQIYE